MSVSEAELRRAVNILDTYRAQLENLQKQQELLALSVEELMRARETMSRYQKAGKGAQVLVPIGGNAFLFGQITESERAILGIGSDVLVEEEVPKSIERLDLRIKALQEAAGSLAARAAELGERVQAQSEFVEGVYEKLAQQQEAGAVKKPDG